MGTSVVEKIYDWMPWPIQNALVSLYGLKLTRREYGREFEKRLREFQGHQWMSETEIRDYRDRMLAKLVKCAYENVPYYRSVMQERDLQPGDITTAEDLTKLPVLTREDVRENMEDLISRSCNPSDLILGHTSGTTGSPLEFYYDRNVCLYKNVIDWRQKGMGGVRFGDKVAYFLGRVVVPLDRKKPPFWRHNLVMNHLLCSSFHLSEENVRHYVKKLQSFKPKAIEGYPSTLFIVAKFLKSKGMTIPVKAVFSSSETLFPQQREVIEESFETDLFDYYGLAERTVFATECDKHEGHHIDTDFGVVELLGSNGDPVEDGELGRIVSTGLHNYAMPLIRYRTSDITSIRPQRCSCGRPFPLMDDVTTKEEDIITTKDGRLISSSILTHPFKPMTNIAESQIIQEDRDILRVKIVRRSGYSDADTDHLLRELSARIGEDIKIDIEFVDSIERTGAGKFRWVISKVPLEF